MNGRKKSFEILKAAIGSDDKTLWMHCASLGEFEQGVPIIQELKVMFPEHKIVLTFFSPSGYEIKKDTPLADVVAYLPFDTKSNARRFVSVVHPSIALFVKYEIWPNYLFELQAEEIPALLVSGLFRKKQVYFKPFGGFMRKALRTMNHFFVQDTASKELLMKLDIANSTVSGDTRFDRVSHQIEMDNSLDFMDAFVGDSLCVVCGSTWPEDEALLLESINTSEVKVKYVIAPHKIDAAKIENFRAQLNVSSILYSEVTPNSNSTSSDDLSQHSVFIIDTIGYLTKIYSYAHIAYVGGAAGDTGLHNILEPATFGVPIIIGQNFQDFPEASKLQQLAGLFSVATTEECTTIIKKLLADKTFRNKTGMIAGHFVNSNTGATQLIMEYIKSLNGDRFV